MIGIRMGHSLWLILLAATAITATGCKKEEPSFEIVPLEQAKIERIEVNPDGTGTITVSYYNEEKGEEVVGTGLVTGETEIMISGALATLRDLREGERVHGEVRLEKDGAQRRQIALKIYVDRPKPVGGEEG